MKLDSPSKFLQQKRKGNFGSLLNQSKDYLASMTTKGIYALLITILLKDSIERSVRHHLIEMW